MPAEAVNIGPFIVDLVGGAFLVTYLLYQYANVWRQRPIVLISTFVAWYASIIMLCILPLDVSDTIYRQCLQDNSLPLLNATTPQPDNTSVRVSRQLSNETGDGGQKNCEAPLIGAPNEILVITYKVVYWSSQVLTWLALPMMQSYARAGDFTVLAKLRSALIENLIFYASYVLIFIVILIYLAAKGENLTPSTLMTIGITASNTWGLFLLVFLLGYGLVEVPRLYWQKSQLHHMRSLIYFKVAQISMERVDAEEELEEVISIVKKTSDYVQNNFTHLWKYVEIIQAKCPESRRRQRNRNVALGSEGPELTDISQASLAKLHKRLMTAEQMDLRCQARWVNIIKKSFYLEDVCDNLAGSHTYKHSAGLEYDGFFKLLCTPKLEWYWHCLFFPWYHRFLAALVTVMSVTLMWSELTFSVKSPVLSLYALIIQATQQSHQFILMELLTILTLAYLSISAYYTIFKLRVLNYYYLSPHHNTDENSLIFSGLLLCRLTPPICLNYLSLIHLDSHITSGVDMVPAAYTTVMGHMDVISFITGGFNIYFPALIIVLSLLTFFNVGHRFLHCLGFEQFIGDNDMTNELVEEGRVLVSREKSYLQRAIDREQRKKELTNLVGRDAMNSGHSTADADNSEARLTADPINYRSSDATDFRPRQPAGNIFDDI